jgi:DNA polymerase-3 subunit delta
MASPSQLLKEISAGKFRPAYYFYGAEDYRIIEAEKYVAKQFLPDLQMTTNFQRIDGRKASADDIVMALSTMPMLGEKQVFVVSEFQSFRPKDVERVLKLIDPKDVGRVVIFSSPSQRTPRKSSAFFKTISTAAEAVEFNRLTVQEAANMIRQRLKKEEISIENDALQLLLELISGSRGGLENEISKLVDYKAKGETISVEDIRRIGSGYELVNIFEVADLVIDGQRKKVIQTIDLLIHEGNSPITIITLLQQHFLSLYLVKNGKSPLGNRNFLIPRFRKQAQRFDNEQLEQVIIDIAETDSDLRRSKVPPQTQVEMLALKLIDSVKSARG